MTVKKEILFLSHRIPYPPDKGDKIRSWRLFKHLTDRFDVHLACFVDDKRDLAHRGFLDNLCASSTFVQLSPTTARLKSVTSFFSKRALSFGFYRDRKMTAAITNLRKRGLAAEIVFSSSMAPYIAAPVVGRKRIIDFCDADSEKWRQYALETRGLLRWVYEREGKLLAQAETQIANWADASFAVTAKEAALFNQRAACRHHVDWWSNGVDIEYFDPAHVFDPLPAACDVNFVGAMDYRPNVEAVFDFVRDAWPKIRAAAPNANFSIVGANPAAKIRALDSVNGITVTGRVDDVRPWLAQAKIVVAPLRIARGIQNKVLEAMAMAKPIVAMPDAVDGIECSSDAVRIVQRPDEMAAEIVNLLSDRNRRDAMGAAARAAAIENYDWDIRLGRFDAALDRLKL